MADRERWAIYCRISRARRTDKDGRTVVETLGVERQEPPPRALVERMGGEVVKVYVDNDLSAYSGKRRPGYETMLADAKAGVIVGIAAWHPDRLTRQPVENERLISLTEAHGTKLATALAGDHNLNTPAGRMMFRQLGTIARYESEHKAERLLAKAEELAMDGRPHGGPRPFGYEPDGVTVREPEAAILRDAATRLLGGEPLNPIARGHGLDATTLRRALLAPRTAGLRQHRGEVVGDADWPAVISGQQQRDLAALFGRPGRKALGRPEAFTYSGIIRCARCSRPMHSAGQGRVSCRAGRGYDGCGASTLAAPLEAHLDELVITALCGATFARVLERRLAAAGDATELLARRDRARGELDALAEAKGVLTVSEYLILRRGLAAALTAAERRLASLPEVAALLDIPTAEAKLRQAWSGWTVAERRHVITAVLDVAMVEPAGRGQRFDGSRVKPHWLA